ncbi:MAG: hypothetical protein M1434_06760 [Chloroflexi bacterium]|nr:hypothetical protein [Chloroflexota bacterium]
MYFILHEDEPAEFVMQALREGGAIDVEEREIETVDGQQWAAFNITVEDEYEMRRLVALVNHDLDPDEKDPKMIGAALARAGEWMLNEYGPGKRGDRSAEQTTDDSD